MIWALAGGYYKTWTRLAKGDRLYFYAMTPVKGVIGYGTVSETFVEEKNLIWPEEVKRKEVLWPLQIRFKIQSLVPLESWETKKIPIARGAIVFQKALQLLKPELAEFLCEAFSKSE